MNVMTLFGLKVHADGTIGQFLDECKKESAKYNKAIFIAIDDKSGKWTVRWSTLGLTPAEVNFALDLTKATTVEEMRKGG